MNRHAISLFVLALAACSAVSCYDDFIKDYDQPNMGFALSRQVRTVIESKNSIYVGVSISGKREVDLNDYATFDIEEGLLAGTGKTLLPASYYNLADPNTFRVRRTGLAVADVEITFTDDFYADPASLTGIYALPFRLTGVSIPAVKDSTGYVNPAGAIRGQADSAIVAIKYINEYSGVWYRTGTLTDEATGTSVPYGDTRDIINSPTVTLTTSGRYSLGRSGIANAASGSMTLVIDKPGADESPLTVSGTDITVTSARLVKKGNYTFYSGTDPCPQIELEYRWISGGNTYLVKEKLILRQWAENALRIETF